MSYDTEININNKVCNVNSKIGNIIRHFLSVDHCTKYFIHNLIKTSLDLSFIIYKMTF